MMTEKSVATLSYSGSLFSVLSALTLTDWGIIVGILTAIGTCVFNIHYQWQKNAREKELHRLRMKRLREDRRKKSTPVAHERREAESEIVQ